MRRWFPKKLFAPAAAAVLSIFFLHPSESKASTNLPPRAPPVANPAATQAQPRPSTQFVIPQTPAFSHGGGTLGLENSPQGLSLVYKKDGQADITVPLDVGFQDTIGTITRIHYGIGHSVIMAERVLESGTTEYYAVVTVGAADVAAGRDKLPGNELINSYGIVLPERPLGSAFTESALFTFAGNGIVEYIPLGEDESRICTLSGLDGTGANSTVIEYRGLYFIMQAGTVPLYAVKASGDGVDTVPWDYPQGWALDSLLRVEMREGGFTMVFSSQVGELKMNVDVPEEGGLHSVGISSIHR